jgi:hypothetical protein
MVLAVYEYSKSAGEGNRTRVYFLFFSFMDDVSVVWSVGGKAVPTALQVFFIHVFQYTRKG